MADGLDLEAGERAGDETCIIAMRVIRDLQSDAANDRGYINALKASSRKLHDLFEKHGVDPMQDWPKWFAAVEKVMARAAKFRSTLEELDRNFGFETHYCRVCGEADPMADCDAALLVKKVLADE